MSAVDVAPLPPGCRLSLRLVVNLNAALHGRLAAERAAAEVIGPDVAHHLVDPEGLLGLDPFRATELDDGLDRLLAAEPDRWLLALPVPGALGPLRGPVELNTAALAAGEAAVAAGGGLALVPQRVGQAVQWRVHAAARPFAPPTLYEAERELSEAVLRAATTLTHLDVAVGLPAPAGRRAGPRPRLPAPRAARRRPRGPPARRDRRGAGHRRRGDHPARGRGALPRAPRRPDRRRPGPLRRRGLARGLIPARASGWCAPGRTPSTA